MKALGGVKVLDFTENLAGNLTTMYLASFGAEVIKVEKPNEGNKSRKWKPQKAGKSLYFNYLNSGKKSMTLDINKREEIEILKQIIEKVDIICESYGPGVMESLGLGYDDVIKINPKIIYASYSYFGHTGPYKNKVGSSCVAQALGVSMDMTGTVNSYPIKAGVAMGEYYGAGYLATGITLALINKQINGKGQKIDVSLLDSLFSIIEAAPATYSMSGEIQTRKGNFDPACAPYDTFKTNDGFVAIGVANEEQWKNLCKHVIYMPELIDDPRFSTNEGRCDDYLNKLRPIVESYTVTTSKYDIEKRCRAVGIPSGEVLDVPGIVTHPHIVENDFMVEIVDNEVGKTKVPKLPIELSDTPIILDSCAPELGKDTDDILNEFGINKEYMESAKN
ncbi:CaiB/BaiF CoA transferase family protein [Serpentinicella alkaliphila]|uniref:CoA:oxalate CoA-transferase n=1 Tax=Serpentinicella alkaliphila TaxID=1734049 RepID=A0A4R2TYJ5_9FIRM|nr:CoA transferase [Serpentinicella alkaliphila]QUH24946.1 CoA transferase [Serpentinicella alkaliphila]TCQ02749.1 CoA:oxalate CoA-transferase [Serpentinicella alkaliphila]